MRLHKSLGAFMTTWLGVGSWNWPSVVSEILTMLLRFKITNGAAPDCNTELDIFKRSGS